MNLAEFLTPIGLAVLILVIFRESQRDRAKENERDDKRRDDEYKQRQQDTRQWFMMFSVLTGKQIEIKTIVERSEHTSEISQTQIIQSLEEFKGLFIMTIDMMMEDPHATFERIKRMQKAWTEGDMEKAQAVADENPENRTAEAEPEVKPE